LNGSIQTSFLLSFTQNSECNFDLPFHRSGSDNATLSQLVDAMATLFPGVVLPSRTGASQTAVSAHFKTLGNAFVCFHGVFAAPPLLLK